MVPNILEAAANRARNDFRFAAGLVVVAGCRDTRYRCYIAAMDAAAYSVATFLSLFIEREIKIEGECIAQLAAEEGLAHMCSRWKSAALLAANVAGEFPDSASDWLKAARSATRAARIAQNYLSARTAPPDGTACDGGTAPPDGTACDGDTAPPDGTACDGDTAPDGASTMALDAS
jgi:hypothetical protein